MGVLCCTDSQTLVLYRREDVVVELSDVLDVVANLVDGIGQLTHLKIRYI